MILTGETKIPSEKPVPIPHGPPQIPHQLSWDGMWATMVRGQ